MLTVETEHTPGAALELAAQKLLQTMAVIIAQNRRMAASIEAELLEEPVCTW
jgi:hypothetical protein